MNSLLSMHRAFVVQFHADTDLAKGHIAGRVEHVQSGQATHFATVDEFLAFLARGLTALSAEPLRHRRPPVQGGGPRVLVKRHGTERTRRPTASITRGVTRRSICTGQPGSRCWSSIRVDNGLRAEERSHARCDAQSCGD